MRLVDLDPFLETIDDAIKRMVMTRNGLGAELYINLKESLVGLPIHKQPELPMTPDRIVRALDKLKKANGEQIVIVETPDGTLSVRLQDALIYEGYQGEIVIDSE